MIIQVLNDDHASAFLTLRLFGLRESPASFGSSYEEEHSRTDQQIVAHLVGSPDRKFLGCFNDAELVGVVGVGRAQSVKERHIAFVSVNHYFQSDSYSTVNRTSRSACLPSVFAT